MNMYVRVSSATLGHSQWPLKCHRKVKQYKSAETAECLYCGDSKIKEIRRLVTPPRESEAKDDLE